MIIEIPGKPIPLARPRFWASGSKFGARDGQKMEKAVVRGTMVIALREALNSEIKASVVDASKLASAPCFSILMQFIFTFPKSWSKKKVSDQKDNLENGITIVHPIKPDLDNLIKFYLDCATGVIWDDDAKVTRIAAQKCYGIEAKTILNVYPYGSKENLA